MIALLSPAKRLKEIDRSEGPEEGTQPPFLEKAREIMQDHAGKELAELVRLHKVSEEIARLNRSRNAEWLSRDGQGMVRAGDLFDGEVYRDWPQKFGQRRIGNMLRIKYSSFRVYMVCCAPWIWCFLSTGDGEQNVCGSAQRPLFFLVRELPQKIFDLSKNAPIVDLSSAEYIKAADSPENRSLFHKVDFLEDKRDGRALDPFRYI